MPADVKYNKKDYPLQLQFCRLMISAVVANEPTLTNGYRWSALFSKLYDHKIINSSYLMVSAENMQISEVSYRSPRSATKEADPFTLSFNGETDVLSPIPGLADEEKIIKALMKRTGLRKGQIQYGTHYKNERVEATDWVEDPKALLVHCVAFLEDCGIKAQDIPRFPKNNKFGNNRYWFHSTTKSNSLDDMRDITDSGRFWTLEDIDDLTTSYLMSLAKDIIAGNPKRQIRCAVPAGANNPGGIVELVATPAPSVTVNKSTPADAESYIRDFIFAIRTYPVACSLIAGGRPVYDPVVQFYLMGHPDVGNQHNWLSSLLSAKYTCGWADRMAEEALEHDLKIHPSTTEQEAVTDPEEEGDDEGDDEDKDIDINLVDHSMRETKYTALEQLRITVEMTTAAIEHSKSTGIPLRKSKKLISAFHAKLMESLESAASDISLLPPIQEFSGWGRSKMKPHPMTALGCQAMRIHGHDKEDKILKALLNKVKAEA